MEGQAATRSARLVGFSFLWCVVCASPSVIILLAVARRIFDLMGVVGSTLPWRHPAAAAFFVPRTAFVFAGGIAPSSLWSALYTVHTHPALDSHARACCIASLVFGCVTVFQTPGHLHTSCTTCFDTQQA